MNSNLKIFCVFFGTFLFYLFMAELNLLEIKMDRKKNKSDQEKYDKLSITIKIYRISEFLTLFFFFIFICLINCYRLSGDISLLANIFFIFFLGLMAIPFIFFATIVKNQSFEREIITDRLTNYFYKKQQKKKPKEDEKKDK